MGGPEGPAVRERPWSWEVGWGQLVVLGNGSLTVSTHT